MSVPRGSCSGVFGCMRSAVTAKVRSVAEHAPSARQFPRTTSPVTSPSVVSLLIFRTLVMPSRRLGGACLLAARVVGRTCLWVLLACALACFLLSTWARPTAWFRASAVVKAASAALTIPFPSDVSVFQSIKSGGGEDADLPLLPGSATFPIVLQWGSVLVAALCTAGLLPGWRAAAARHLRSRSSSGQASRVGFLNTLRRAATQPLPPRRFWSWACGGLNPLEVLFLLVWIGFAGTYLYANIDKRMKRLQGKLARHAASHAAGADAPPSGHVGSGVHWDLQLLQLPGLFLTKRFKELGKAFGESLRGMVPLMFFPVSRSSFLKWLFGADFSHLIKFHRWMSWGTILVACIHGAIYAMQWACAWLQGAGTYAEFAFKLNDCNVTGLLALGAALAIALTSFAWVRTRHYRVFINVHVVGFMLFTLFSLMHDTNLVNYVMPSLLLYGLDRAFRFWQLSSNWALVQPCDLHVEGSVVSLRLRWHAGSRVLPGQTVYLRIPRLSWLQSHPFSIARVQAIDTPHAPDQHPTACGGLLTHMSSVHHAGAVSAGAVSAGAVSAGAVSARSGAAGAVSAGAANAPPLAAQPAFSDAPLDVTVHIKATGKWSKGLRALAATGHAVWVQVEGPYDTCLDPAPASPVVVMIAGGIGITPLLGLLRHYLVHPASRPRTTYLMWTCRALCELRLMGEDLMGAAAPLNPKSDLKPFSSSDPKCGSSSSLELHAGGAATAIKAPSTNFTCPQVVHDVQPLDQFAPTPSAASPHLAVTLPMGVTTPSSAVTLPTSAVTLGRGEGLGEHGLHAERPWLHASLHYTGRGEEAGVWGSYLECMASMACDAGECCAAGSQDHGQHHHQLVCYDHNHDNIVHHCQDHQQHHPHKQHLFQHHQQQQHAHDQQRHVHHQHQHAHRDHHHHQQQQQQHLHAHTAHRLPQAAASLGSPPGSDSPRKPEDPGTYNPARQLKLNEKKLLLSPHPVASPALYAACVTLAVGGGFAALLAAAYADVYRTRATGEGVYHPLLGALQWLLLAVGTMLPPLLLLKAAAAFQSFTSKASCLSLPSRHSYNFSQPSLSSAHGQPGQHWGGGSGYSGSVGGTGNAGSGSGGVGMDHEQGGGSMARLAPSGGVEPAQKLAVTPGHGPRLQLVPSGSAEGGLELHRGRPDVAALLRRVLAAHAGECVAVEVLVGGPPAMWEAALEACVRVQGEVEVAGAPVLRPRRVAHQH